MTTRVLALWCPDWPAVAAATQDALAPEHPVAVLSAGRVVACTASARAEGVRRGMRRRDAQARCPGLHLADADTARDTRLFEPVATAIETLTPGIEVLRPGLTVLAAHRATPYYGSERRLGEHLVAAVAALAVDCRVGVADQLSTAVIAARGQQIVPVGRSAQFLAALSIRTLAADPYLASPDRTELIDLLWRLGIRRIGDFAALPRTAVTTRFGPDAARAHRLARGEPEPTPTARRIPPDLHATMECDPPIARIDAAGFAGRALAWELHHRLTAASAACTRLLVQATTTDGRQLQRVWRTAQALTPQQTADRIRWQLDGWLTTRRTTGTPPAPIATLRLEPVELVTTDTLQLGLWGGTGDATDRTQRALLRVQSLLGADSVYNGVLGGGHGPTQRITLIPLGTPSTPERHAPWPGTLPGPAPSVLPNTPVQLLDADNRPVTITDRGRFTAAPTQLHWNNHSRPVRWWAGPWLTDTHWWHPAGSEPTARAQVLLHDCRALLLHYRTGWTIEGSYE